MQGRLESGYVVVVGTCAGTTHLESNLLALSLCMPTLDFSTSTLNCHTYGTRNKNRTYTNRVKVCCATTTPFGNNNITLQIFKEQFCSTMETKNPVFLRTGFVNLVISNYVVIHKPLFLCRHQYCFSLGNMRPATLMCEVFG